MAFEIIKLTYLLNYMNCNVDVISRQRATARLWCVYVFLYLNF